MATIRVCDWCGEPAPDKPPARGAEWGKMMDIIGKVDCCETHEQAGADTDWKALITEAVHNSPAPSGEDGSRERPYYFQAGMDVEKGLYYHIWGNKYSAKKSVKDCQVTPGHDETIWQYVEPYTPPTEE